MEARLMKLWCCSQEAYLCVWNKQVMFWKSVEKIAWGHISFFTGQLKSWIARLVPLGFEACPSWVRGFEGCRVGWAGLEVTELTVAAAQNWPLQLREWPAIVSIASFSTFFSSVTFLSKLACLELLSWNCHRPYYLPLQSRGKKKGRMKL